MRSDGATLKTLNVTRLSAVAVLLLGLWTSAPAQVQSAPLFVRGDCNADGSLDLSDAIFILIFNFADGTTPTCFDACDCNDDGQVTGQVTDAVYLLNYQFGAGAPPPAPGPVSCGIDPTDDALTCQSYTHCEPPPPPPDPCPVLSVSSSDGQRNSDIAIAPASGNFFMVWEDDRDADGLSQVRAGAFTPDEDDLIDPFTVNTTSSGQQVNPAIAIAADESFVVVWEDDSNRNGLFNIRTRAFGVDGLERFPQFTVNTSSRGQQLQPDVAVAANGDFVIVWQSDGDDDGLFQLEARGFAPDGIERIAEFTVNARSAGQQIDPAIAMDPDGNFVVVWANDGDGDGLFEVFARGFDASGLERIPQFTVNPRSAGQQLKPAIGMDANGNFIVVWEDDRDGDGSFQVHARAFNADGTERLARFTVNVFSAGQQINPAVSMDPEGNFAVAWEDDRDGDGEFHIRMRSFNADGSEHIEHTKVDCTEPAQHVDPTIALASGRVHVFWDEIDETEVARVIGRILEKPETPPADPVAQ